MDLEKDQDNNNDIEMLNPNKNNRFTQMDRIELDEEQLSNKSEKYDNIE